jgi:beta-aspartyl-peptidase (threonine type)
MTYGIIVHGGAGDDYDDRLEEFQSGVAQAARAGWAVLAAGGSALDAVEAAVQVMEACPTFDAGEGSFLNQNGEIEMDAIIMDGSTLKSGSVAAIQRVQHPVHVARLVMEHTPHALIVGSGADAFARRMGIPAFVMSPAKQSEIPPSPSSQPGDTVGAVALDASGHLAVATSTGGTLGKLPGRVGDSPLVGSGAYADDLSGGASATGVGEHLMRIVISKSACDLMGQGQHPQQAAEAIMRRLEERVPGGIGGIILMDPQGRVGAAYNTHHMVHAWISSEQPLQVRG